VREIRWTDQSEDHVWKHRVTPAEVEEVVNTSPRYVRVSGDITYIFGQTDAGRALIVVLTDAVDGRDFVVTARDMTDSELRLYERRGR